MHKERSATHTIYFEVTDRKEFFFSYPKNALPPLVIDCLLSIVVVVVVLLVDGKTA